MFKNLHKFSQKNLIFFFNYFYKKKSKINFYFDPQNVVLRNVEVKFRFFRNFLKVFCHFLAQKLFVIYKNMLGGLLEKIHYTNHKNQEYANRKKDLNRHHGPLRKLLISLGDKEKNNS